MKFLFEEGRITLQDDSNNYRGELTYQIEDEKTMVIDHTYVLDEYRGHGYSLMLLKQAVEYAKEHQMKIVPVCSYAKEVMENKEEYHKYLK